MTWIYVRMYVTIIYHLAENFGGKNIWRIAQIMAFARFYFGNFTVPLLHLV